ncbi:hypothetical protein CON36_19490 [Bacillus cereus]|uniref:Uncharacterized protein n=1 Tax=Bacillus cereus TaxID=1396 RepID=A0A9X6SXH1_BACCE|nr:hypothetical protein [Bacillus cereus]PDZ97105.1 hypothetical protein CON36_19490 [Bacillus cereus]PFJ51043.1 hypothetical protein COJ02_25720 [Bacillus thuringiensis]PHC21721.1 hypothetical protein COF00_23425 [Bacillus wiedmannii]
MTEIEQLEQIKKNILSLSMSMTDAPLRGLSESQIWTVNKTLENVLGKTDITTESLIRESHEKRWFKPNNK